jgi:hypothetical protein
MFHRGPRVTLGQSQTRQPHNSNLISRRQRSLSFWAVFWNPMTWALATLVGMTMFGHQGGLFHETRDQHSLLLRNLSTNQEDSVWHWQPHVAEMVAKRDCRYPMQFVYNFETGIGRRIKVQEGTLIEDKPMTNRERRLPSVSNQDDDNTPSDGCQFINPKHNKQSPNCVTLHEIDTAESSVTFINCGGSRCAFYLPDSEANGNPNNADQRVVFKTQK